MLVERVLGYNGDGHALEALFLDGVEVQQVTCYELDPDDRMLRRGRGEEWRERQYTIAATASPAAAELIRRWADQTAEDGAVDDELHDVIDGEVVDTDVPQLPPGQQQ